MPRHGDTDGEKLALAGIELLTEGDAVELAATDTVTDVDAAALGVTDAELGTQMHVNWSGAPQETSQQRVPRHCDDVAVTLRETETVAAALLVTLSDAATLAVTDDVGVTDAAGDDVADVVGLRKERRALARTQEARVARACAGAAAATPARPPARTVMSTARRPRAPRPGKSRRFASCARAGWFARGKVWRQARAQRPLARASPLQRRRSCG